MLTKYHKKRNFAITPEPYGKEKKSGKKYLYVVHKHAASHLHYDLRLELDGVLKSWAVPKGPSLNPAIKRLAVHVEDHPIAYGSFEGIIPTGQYGGGTVMLWDTGTWECINSDIHDAYQKGNLTFVLYGKKLKGIWKLLQFKGDPKNWFLMKVEDKYAITEKDKDITETKMLSALSRRSMEGIAKAASSKKKTTKSPHKSSQKHAKR